MAAQPFEPLPSGAPVEQPPLVMEAATPTGQEAELSDELQLQGWTAALDRLEEDLDLAEQLLCEPDRVSLPPWSPPTLGPLPIELLGRATDLNRRQQTVRARLTAALDANTRQRGYAARVSDATSQPVRPTYFDQTL